MAVKNVDYEYQGRARTSVLFYLMLTISTMVAAAGFFADPGTHRGANPAWVQYTVGGMGAFFVIGVLYALVCDFRYGIRVDQKFGLLIWWQGYLPLKEKVIPVSSIKSICSNLDSENRSLLLLDSQGECIELPDWCVPSPHHNWAYSIKNAFPHIEVIEELTKVGKITKK